jgi:hypothetical protein
MNKDSILSLLSSVIGNLLAVRIFDYKIINLINQGVTLNLIAQLALGLKAGMLKIGQLKNLKNQKVFITVTY